MPKWTLWYSDGSTFTSQEGKPEDSPPWGVVLITQEVENMDMLAYQKDYFLYRTDWEQWIEVDNFGLMDHMIHNAHNISCVRGGRWMPTNEWKALQKRAAVDLRGK